MTRVHFELNPIPDLYGDNNIYSTFLWRMGVQRGRLKVSFPYDNELNSSDTKIFRMNCHNLGVAMDSGVITHISLSGSRFF